MKIFSHKKGCNLGMNQAHVEPRPIPLMNGTCDGKSDKYFVKLKLCRDSTPTSMSLGCFV